MRKSLFTEAQIIGILKQAEAGRMVTDLCREHGITQATFYRWRSKYSGMEVSDAQELNRFVALHVTPVVLHVTPDFPQHSRL